MHGATIKTTIKIFKEIRPVAAIKIHDDRRTDMTKLTGAFYGNENLPET